MVFFSAILKDRAIDLLIVNVNRAVNYESLFPLLAERLLLQIVYYSNKYSFQKFKTSDYCDLIKCLDTVLSTSFDLEAMDSGSEALILGQVVSLCNQGDVSSALAEASKLNLATIANQDVFLTLSHHICIALLTDGQCDAALEYFTDTVLKMSLRRKLLQHQKLINKI